MYYEKSDFLEGEGGNMKYEHIVFDIDGTLIDTEYVVLHSLQETLRTLCGKEIPVSELTFALGITGADALKILEVKDISHTLELWIENMRKYADTVMVFDGITELLENLRTRGVKMGIVTSKTREGFEEEFCQLSIREYFRTIVCADDTQEHKPNAAPLWKYKELSGMSGGKILYVGDSAYDSRCAKNAGIDFALAVWGSHSKSIEADYFLEKPADVLSVITTF